MSSAEAIHDTVFWGVAVDVQGVLLVTALVWRTPRYVETWVEWMLGATVLAYGELKRRDLPSQVADYTLWLAYLAAILSSVVLLLLTLLVRFLSCVSTVTWLYPAAATLWVAGWFGYFLAAGPDVLLQRDTRLGSSLPGRDALLVWLWPLLSAAFVLWVALGRAVRHRVRGDEHAPLLSGAGQGSSL